MNLEKIENRLEFLSNVFAYTLLHKGLNAGQRICITQERMALLAVREVWLSKNKKIEPRYTLPKHLENKVQKINQKIKDTGWIKPPFTPIF